MPVLRDALAKANALREKGLQILEMASLRAVAQTALAEVMGLPMERGPPLLNQENGAIFLTLLD